MQAQLGKLTDGGEENSPCVNAKVIDPFGAAAPASSPITLTVNTGPFWAVAPKGSMTYDSTQGNFLRLHPSWGLAWASQDLTQASPSQA